MTSANLLEMRNVDKSFNGIPVLRQAEFALRKGEDRKSVV